MTRLLDARTSQNKSTTDLLSTTILPANTPTLIGIVGLNTTGASGVIRVQFTGIAELRLPEPLTNDTIIGLVIVRGTDLSGTLVGNALYGTGNTVSPLQVVTIIASDYNVPAPPSGELVYTMFLFSTSSATRVGIESFNATAYSD